MTNIFQINNNCPQEIQKQSQNKDRYHGEKKHGHLLLAGSSPASVLSRSFSGHFDINVCRMTREFDKNTDIDCGHNEQRDDDHKCQADEVVGEFDSNEFLVVVHELDPEELNP